MISLRPVVKPPHRRHVSVHREHAVGGDDTETLCLRFLQTTLQVGHIGVGIAVTFRLAQPDAVDDGGMIQRVGDDGILVGEQRLEQSAVGIETCRIKDGVFRVEIFGNRLFKLLVQVLRTADKAHGRHAVAVCVHRTLGRLDEPLVVGQSQIVVRTEVQYFLALVHADVRTLGRGNDTFVLIQAGRLDVGQLICQKCFEIPIHTGSIFSVISQSCHFFLKQRMKRD